MSRREWRCRNPHCQVPHGVVLGRLTSDGGLVLSPAVNRFAVYLDTGRAEISCPSCDAARQFRGASVRTC